MMAKVFISHSSDDKALVNQIADALHKYGHEILIDTTLLKPGDDIFETLMAALKSADAMLVVLTENSIRSANVLSEIGAAKALEGKAFKIIPVVIGNIEIPRMMGDRYFLRWNPEEHENVIRSVHEMLQQITPEPVAEEEKAQTVFRIGSRGEQVAALQQMLKKTVAPELTADGVYGPATAKAVGDFQSKYDLASTGEIDGATFFRLDEIAREQEQTLAEPIETTATASWIIRLNPQTWNLSKLITGYETSFHSHDTRDGSKRPDYDTFQRVKTGDIIIGYAFEPINKFVCTFRVQKELHTHPSLGEIISVNVEQGLGNGIPITAIKTLEYEKEIFSKETKIRLFKLSDSIYKEIVKHTALLDNAQTFVEVPPEKKTQNSYLSKSPFTIRDGIEPVLGVKTVAAEVADLIRNMKTKEFGKMVGVFGNWGRGKTFLVEQVWKVLEADKNQPFIRVNFHAWKFQDTHASWAYLYEAFARKYFEKENGWFKNWFVQFRKRLRLNLERHGSWPIVKFILTLGIVAGSAIFAVNGLDKNINYLFWFSLTGVGLSGIFLQLIRFYKQYNLKDKAIDLFNKYYTKPTFQDLLGIQSEIQNELRNLLECWLPEKNGEPEKQILLFVDDIDRCSEDRIIQIIDALRVMLDDEQISKRVIVIAAIDERVLRRAIKWKYRELLGADKKLMNDLKAWEETTRQITSEYMDKLFLSGIKLGTLTETERIEIYQQFSNGKVQAKEIAPEKPETREPEVKTETPAEKEPYRKPMESVDPLVLTKPLDQNPTPTEEKKTAPVPVQTGKPETSFELAFDENEFLVNMIREVHDVTPRQIRIFYYRYMLARNLLTVALTQSNTETKYEPGYRNELLARLLQHYTGLRSNEELLNDRKILNLREPKTADTTIATLIKDKDPQLINEILEALEMVIAY